MRYALPLKSRNRNFNTLKRNVNVIAEYWLENRRKQNDE